ncbi:hypothetical protein MKW94_012206 [Papaver nudicaule]|uniref:Uncharacterized protein n=1 Tax=Papaver nudicaule TaxID=74823 RepID=A0AA41SID2_PAPNU|nr:hypothetical protein [Papaver nudicaule]
MAKLFSLILGLVLLLIVAVSASTDQENVGVSTFSVSASSTTSDFSCVDGDAYSEVLYPTSDCSVCKTWCKDECSELGGDVVNSKCSLQTKFVVRCQCCCYEPPPPPPPSPPPPPPTPCGQPGDTSSETTIITSDCNDCTNWCKEECADVGGYVVDDKCSIGESKFARRCQCCCRENPVPTTHLHQVALPKLVPKR